MSTRTPPPLPDLDRPARLRDSLQVGPSGGGWTAADEAGRVYQVSADIAALMRALDGASPPEQLASRLRTETGRGWTTDAVEQALNSLAQKGFLDDGSTVPSAARWIRYVPPLTLQVTLLDPSRLLGRMDSGLRRLLSRPTVIASTVIVLVGLAALALNFGDVVQVLGNRLPLGVYLWVIVGMFAATMLHEFGHGMALTAFGGRTRRMGFMLFYLTPAFFCDVSDGWRLDSKMHRVWIALSGVLTQSFLAGLAALAAPLTADPAVKSALLLFAVFGYIAALVNLIPFVKFDGYIALMSYVNVSHLRDKAMRDARRLLARLMFGSSRDYELPDIRWARAFGLACLLFPVYLVGTALSLWLDVISGFGIVGAWVCLIIVALVLLGLVGGYGVIVKEATGSSRLRISAVSAALLAVVLAAGFFLRVPSTANAGFIQDQQGPALVFAESSAVPDLDAGQEIKVFRSGLVLQTEAGTFAVADPAPHLRMIPASVLAPVDLGEDVQLSALTFPLEQTAADDAAVPRFGTAQIQMGTTTFFEWLYQRFIVPALP